MPLKIFTKVGNVSDLNIARYCAGMGVDLVGFDVDPRSSNYVTPQKFTEITGWISGPKFVGELSAEISSEESKLLKTYPLDMVEYPLEIPGQLKKELKFPSIGRFNVNNNIDNLPLQNQLDTTVVNYILLESDEETIEKNHIERIAEIARSYPVLLGFGLHKGNILEVLEKTGVEGIALKSSGEVKPGYHPFDELAEILELLEIND